MQRIGDALQHTTDRSVARLLVCHPPFRHRGWRTPHAVLKSRIKEIDREMSAGNEASIDAIQGVTLLLGNREMVKSPFGKLLYVEVAAISRGGIVRSPCDAIGSLAGKAPPGSGGSARPPRSTVARSRMTICSSCAIDGATPITPGNAASAMRTLGRSEDSAKPPLKRHRTRNGS